MAGSSIIAESVSSSVVAHIGAVRGEVFILRALGGLAVAKKGDPIYEDDVVSTKNSAAALVYAENGGVLTFGSLAAVQFNPALTERIDNEFSNASLGLGNNTPFDLLEELINNGEDIESVLASPSASSRDTEDGPLESSFNNDIVVWQRSGSEIIPISGFRSPSSEFETDIFGNQIGNNILSSGIDLFGVRSDDQEAELVPADLSAQNDTLVVQEDSLSNAASVANNDSSASGNPLTYELIPDRNVQNGTLVFNNDGSYIYTPNTNFSGADSFQYLVTNIIAGESSTQTVAITVSGVNDLPVALDDSFTLDEDSDLSASVLSNDSDVDDDSLTVNTSPVSDVSNGSLLLNADGTFTYTPDANFNGVDSFTYSISDGNGGEQQATVNITINPVIDTPVALADSFSAIEDTLFSNTLLNGLLQNDSHGDGDTLTLNTTPVSSVSNGVLVLSSDGTFTYTPNDNFNGTDSFVYEISDSNGATAQATATITVDSVTDLVTASEIETGNEDNNIVSTVSTGDSTSSGGALSYSLISGPTNGTLSSPINTLTGNYTYTPNADYVGGDSFQYLVSDSASGESSVETVSITVNSVVDLTAMDDTLIVAFNTLTGGDVSTNDNTTSSGGDAGLTFSLDSDVSNGVLVFNADGTYTYNPTGIGSIGGSDSFTYLVTDAASGESSTQSVNITINAENTAPEGSDSSTTIDEDNSYTLLVADFGFSDVVENDTFTGVRIDALPLLGSLTLLGAAVTAGQIIPVASITAGDLIFTPAENGNGSPYTSFTFSVQDSAGSIDSVPNTFTVNVSPISDLPVALNDSFDVIQNTAFTATLANGVLLNDSDGDGDTLTVNTTPVSDVTGGTLVLNSDGTFTYTPNLDFNGSDSFIYEIDDGTGNTTQATVNLSVDFISSSVIGTSGGDAGGDSLVGAAGSDDDIFSGGVDNSVAENIQGVAGTIGEAQANTEGSGNDRLILNGDDGFVSNAGSGAGGGHIRIRGFTVGDVAVDGDADTLVLGDFLRAGDPTFDGTATDAVRFLHFTNNGGGSNGDLLYIDREGGLGDADNSARDQSGGNVFEGIAGGASLFLEFRTLGFDATPGGNDLNSVAQIQNLIDLGFLDFS